MPVVVVALAVAVFAQGTSEFMLSGLVEPIAADVGVSIGSAGLLTSLFAVGMIAGAPLMAMAAGPLPARHSLAGFLAVFLASHVIGALTTTFGVLLATRVVAAVANAGFLAVALAALPGLVGPERVGRATAVILSGVTLACVVGVPAGAVLGDALGWQAAFWAVVAVGAPALAMTSLLVRTEKRARTEPGGSPLWTEWRALRRPEVRAWMALGGLVNAATFASFTYLAVVTTGTGGAGDGWVPVTLALFGIGSFLGVTGSARYTDRRPRMLVTAGLPGLLVVWTVTAATASLLPALLVMSFVSGAASFAVGSTLIGLVVRAASPTAPSLSGAFATAAFNVGAAAGPAIAGLAIEATGTAAAALWTSVAIILAAGAIRGVGEAGS